MVRANLVWAKSGCNQSQDTTNKLKEKHPPRHPNSNEIPIPCDDCDNSFKTDRDKLKKALHSFKKGAAGGPDGFIPQHLIDMTGDALGEPASKLIDALVTFMNLIIFPGKDCLWCKSHCPLKT